MRILILGADGYLGWPTAMSLSMKGHEVLAVDNYLRRNICRQYDVEPLIIPPNLMERAKLWADISGREISVKIGDCTEETFLFKTFQEFEPEAVVHYAEQPSAPYSMMDHRSAKLTLNNNLNSTLNIIWAIKQYAPTCQLIKLGTMGVYGTPNIDIEEGWLEINHNGRKDRFLYPRQASSLYHTTKIQDTDLLWFYVRTWGLKVTDLQQGPVYGISTPETQMDERLGTILNYDELFGTVLNRFVVQSVAGYPLTIYGKGGQTRGYINIQDSISCVELAILNPPKAGELTIYNQVTETFKVTEIAERVARVGRKRGYQVELQQIKNPRVELEEHYYNPCYTGLKKLGLTPHYLTDTLLDDFFSLVEKYKENICVQKIYHGVRW